MPLLRMSSLLYDYYTINLLLRTVQPYRADTPLFSIVIFELFYECFYYIFETRLETHLFFDFGNPFVDSSACVRQGWTRHRCLFLTEDSFHGRLLLLQKQDENDTTRLLININLQYTHSRAY